jgi:hypothetical protein
MLHRLRHAHLLARFVLVWFALSIGVAVASPIVNPQAMELVCSGTGVMKVLVKTDDGVKEVNTATLDCPLCATMSAPLPMVSTTVAAPHPLSFALQTIPAARIAALVGAPLPARGPPAVL